MILDRDLQLELLTKLSSTYPRYYNLDKDYSYNSERYKQVIVNLYYLMQHGLVEEKSLMKTTGFGGNFGLQFELPTITHKGMDFLANDGGLSAILNVVTVKFEANTLKAILANHINRADLPEEKKKTILDTIDELPAESIKHLTTKLLDAGLENIPSALIIISSYLGLS
ncbi:hypothetical protein AO727_17865 [Acinetobacter baumannii]|uniref:hypothetical protein n=1 Tax=Acinetobacter baumannii TaxID=470 RepID=UPI00071835B5|nr:hypothetical protein [Acinetobacter baumannii]KRW34741.1 hypothetical protein AO727_17865 [Acinetobacter baumannii]